MSVALLESASPVGAGATWVQVAPSLWTASVRGEFIGTVEQIGESYVACDGHAVEVGSFGDLGTAKQQVMHPTSRSYETRLRRAERDELRLARVTAAVGGIVIAGSAAMFAAGLLR